MPETVTTSPWLAELTARYGESHIPAGAVKLRGNQGTYAREAWLWFPGGENLALDHYADHWELRASGPQKRVRLEDYGSSGPSAAEIRSVLVLAGMLEARDG